MGSIYDSNVNVSHSTSFPIPGIPPAFCDGIVAAANNDEKSFFCNRMSASTSCH